MKNIEISGPRKLIKFEDEKRFVMFIHFSQFLGYIIPLLGLLVPIVLWQIKKDDSGMVDAHGKMVTNWILSYIIYMAISFLLIVVIIGIIPIIALSTVGIIFPVIGGIRASEGEIWNYPLTIRFIK